MSPSEYQGLVEFLTGQFARADRRFQELTLELSRRLTAIDAQIASFRAEVEKRFRDVSGHFDETYRKLDGWNRDTAPSHSSSGGSRRP